MQMVNIDYNLSDAHYIDGRLSIEGVFMKISAASTTSIERPKKSLEAASSSSSDRLNRNGNLESLVEACLVLSGSSLLLEKTVIHLPAAEGMLSAVSLAVSSSQPPRLNWTFDWGMPVNRRDHYKYSNGANISGTWVQAKLVGSFELFTPDKRHWRGQVVGDGDYVKLKGADGVEAEGPLVEGLLHGSIRWNNPDNSTWIGVFFRGKPRNGRGTLLNTRGVLERGVWVNGKREGSFKRTNPDGSIWTGHYRNGLMVAGAGTFLYSNGTSETGE